MGGQTLLVDVGLVLGVAGLTSLLFARFNQSTVLAWLAAGLVVGPYLPVPVFADHARVEGLSEFGVVLVMFTVGLELRIARFVQMLPVVGLMAVVQIGAMLWVGAVAGQLLAWRATSSLFLGGALAISSTMVVSKVFERNPPEPAVRQQVLGILVLQDVAAVVLITVLTAVAAGAEVSATRAAAVLGQIGLLGAGMLGVGMLVIPPMVRFAVDLKRSDVLVVAMAAHCFTFALIADVAGASPALGAFVAGVLAAESGRAHQVEDAVRPLKDMFAAIFFVSVGMTVDPMLVVRHLPAILGVSAAVIGGQLVSVTIAGVLSGNGLRSSLATGLYLGQIGEFSFVIASIGAAVAPPELRAIVVGVAAVTTFTTPLLAGRAGALVHFVDDHLPRPMRTLLVVYETWVAGLSRVGATDGTAARALRGIVVDAAILGGVVAVTLAAAEPLTAWLNAQGVAVGARTLRWVGVALSLPLVAVLVVYTRQFAAALVARVFTEADRPVIPVLVRAIEFGVLLAVGLPLAAALDLFLPGPIGGVLLALGIAISAVAVWRSVRTAGGAVRTAAEQVAAKLGSSSAETPRIGGLDIEVLDVAERAVGHSLASLDLRASTGATVVAIHRASQTQVSLPNGRERLSAGDRIALVGTPDALGRARALLRNPGPVPD